MRNVSRRTGNRIWILEWGLEATDFRGCGRITCFKGHGFSRAAIEAYDVLALAAEGRIECARPSLGG